MIRPDASRKLKRRSGILGVLFVVLVLASIDIIEIIPLFSPWVDSPYFNYVHHPHDLLAVGVVLFATYKYGLRWGMAAILTYSTSHIFYIIADLSKFFEKGPEYLGILITLLIGLLGIRLIVKIQTLSGLIPICAWCKKIRDDGGYWESVEKYVGEHSRAEFSHSICPDCLKKYFDNKVNVQESGNK